MEGCPQEGLQVCSGGEISAEGLQGERMADPAAQREGRARRRDLLPEDEPVRRQASSGGRHHDVRVQARPPEELEALEAPVGRIVRVAEARLSAGGR